MIPVRILPIIYLSLVSASMKLVNTNPVKVPCRNATDCDDLIDAKCTDGFCTCPDQNPCSPPHEIFINKLREACNNSTRQCLIPHSSCVQNQCTCSVDYTASSNLKKCLKIAQNLTDPCEENVQCAPYLSTCLNDRCVCQQNSHMAGSACFANVQLGHLCAVDEECTGSATRCVSRTCRCKETHVEVGKGCFPVRLDGEECGDSRQCRGGMGEGAWCRRGRCQCGELFHLDGGKCAKDFMLDEVCGDHGDCHQPGSGPTRLECLLGNCKCKTIFREVNGYCVEVSNAFSAQPIGIAGFSAFAVLLCLNALSLI